MNFGNILIIGDSYSTFEGFVPEGYAIYYSSSGGDTDVRKMEETWWHQVISQTDSNLVLNNSWSGSTICYTGYENRDCSKDSSFIFRFNQLKEKGFFKENKIDTVFIFGGTNDSWSNAPLGEPLLSDWKREDLYKVLPAIGNLAYILRETLPDSKIVWLINTEIKEQIGEVIKKACELFGEEYVAFKYIDKIAGHPTIKGMKDIKEQILEKLK
ncbi:MAG: hypothetical protein II234_04660 [Clostridia bacterium]|nr:hypothetical protein [Clostridia bacterium]